MSTLSQLSQQLNSLQDTLRQTQSLIERLSKLSLRPGSEPLDEDDGSARIELAQDIHDSLKQLDEELELLKSDTDEFGTYITTSRRKDGERERDRERENLSANVNRLEEDLSTSRSLFRQAQLSAEKASKAAKAQERELVFRSIVVEAADNQADPTVARHKRQRTQQLSKDEVIANATSDVTAALRRTHDLLSTELTRSRFAQETFDQSTEALKELGEKYSNLDTILSNSRNLLGTLLRSQKSDTWYLETAFYILLTTLAWLVFRRLLYGPFWKLPRFLWSFISLLLNWVVLKPLYFLLLAVGVIRSERVLIKSVDIETTTRSRAPLIIQPSASDFVHFSGEMADQLKRDGVPAGAGGHGAKRGPDILAGSESEKIGRMADQKAGEKEPVRRGDGTVLQDRGDVPVNPKKKTFQEDQPNPKKRDEL